MDSAALGASDCELRQPRSYDVRHRNSSRAAGFVLFYPPRAALRFEATHRNQCATLVCRTCWQLCIRVSFRQDNLAKRIGGAFEMTGTVFQKFDSHETHRDIRKPQGGSESF
jgi:hypothetical protein